MNEKKLMVQKLAIDYNRNAPIGVVSTDPYNYLIYDTLFDDFRIITEIKQDWLLDLPLRGKIDWLGRRKQYGTNVSRIMRSKKFVDMFRADRRRKFVMYSPMDPPYAINPLAYLMNSPTIAHAYENKRYFRDEFAELIRMPEYEICYMNELDRAAAYKELREKYGNFMLQDEESSGSKGTYAIKNADDYVAAIKSLKKFSRGRTIVVSKFIKGEAASIQVCISKHGTFSGGVQKQLIDSKYLSNNKLEGANKWCGGEVGVDYPDIVYHQTQEMASVVGSELASHGYKGVFGLDLIITPEYEVYAIEINARLTGYSHIISDMQLQNGKIPFMLLHALELGNLEYKVTDPTALPSSSLRYKKPVSLLVMNNPLDSDFVMPRYIKPGLYKQKGGKVEFVKPATGLGVLKGEDTMLIMSRHAEGDNVERGRRILKVVKYGKTMARGGDLNAKARKTIKAVKQTFDLPD
ncbi:MAG TPA: ATP-grasp domain-containing protein [Candidatus Saccharimonadales bacterium]|nr:ATP-grasp domain-containing protein [Candidatus Saccharimonadales bacterium]